MRLLLTLDVVPVYYALLIVVFFQWDFHNSILYPSLLTDYFTTLEYKRYAPLIGIAQAVGTLLGGGLTILLSRYLRTRELLLVLPILYAIAFAQLLYLESSQRRLDQIQTEKYVGILESLRTFPELVKRYPLVLFLASSSFLLVIIYISSEFLWFNIYGQYFSEEALTGFLGLMRIIISLVQVTVLYGVTRPLLHWLGVARMNPVYPLTTLISFLGLLLNFNLPAAIGLHLNGDAFYKAINLPVHQLNYNAIPQEFIGRVRALSDGLIYSLGLTLAGVVLWLSHLYLELVQITWLAAGLTVLLLLVRLPMGKFYAQSLEEMIRSDTINLDDFSDYQAQLPPQSSNAIRELLTSGDRYMQIKGLELAASLGHPSQFFPEVKALLLNADAQLRRTVVKLFSTNPDVAAVQQFESLLTQEHKSILRATALEVLIAKQYPFDEQQLHFLLKDSAREIKMLAAMAALQAEVTDNLELKIALPQIWQTELEDTTAKAIARVVVYNNNWKLVRLLKNMLPKASPDTKLEGLEAISAIAVPGDCDLAEVAVAELEHSEPLVRVAAFKLLGITRCQEMLPCIASGLGDRDPRVRQQVANTLTAYGKLGLSLAQDSLSSSNSEVVNTAIAAIGQVKTRQASDILFKHIAPEFQQVTRTRKWQQQIPQSDPSWQPLAVAIEDYHQRLLQKVLYILSCLGYSRTVNAVNRILATTDKRDLANAVEVLVSLSHRRFILPLIPLLEQIVKQEQPANQIVPTSQWLRTKGYKLLLEALESKDRWLRTGALVALARVPSALLQDPDPVVKSVAGEIFPPTCQLLSPTNSSMNRLLILKNVALFKNLSLDELFLIDKALEQEHILAGKTIYAEKSWGWHLYIIAEGTVQIVKQLDGEQQEIKQLSTGDYFGEVALFDDAPRWDGAIALKDCTLLKLEKKRFISLIAQRPHIILEICRFLSQRLRETDKYLSSKKMPSPSGET
jgi:HEAT repeat protein